MTKSGESVTVQRGTKVMRVGAGICVVAGFFMLAGTVAGSGAPKPLGFADFIPLGIGVLTVIAGYALRILDAVEKR